MNIIKKLYLYIKFNWRKIWQCEESYLLKKAANTPVDNIVRKNEELVFEKVTEKNILDCGAFESVDKYVPIYRKMIEAGDYVHYGYLASECVFRHAVKLSGSIKIGSQEICDIGINDGYIHYGYCEPKVRGLGFHAESLFRFSELFNDKNLYAIVDCDNISSLHSCFRNNFSVNKIIRTNYRFFISKTIITEVSERESNDIINNVKNIKHKKC